MATIHIFIALCLIGYTIGQSCMPVKSTDRTMFDYHCSCIRSFISANQIVKAHTVSVNQENNCSVPYLHVDWKVMLEGIDSLKIINIVGADLTFEDNGHSLAKYPLDELVLSKCNIVYLPSYAFTGLQNLKILRILNSKLQVIQEYSLSKLASLRTLEFMHTNVTTIQENAISDLPNLKHFGFSQSNIEIVETGAISVKSQTYIPTSKCLHGRSSSDLELTMGRSLVSANNITLPDDGQSLFIYKSNFGNVSSSAFISNAFPYIIIGGSSFHTLASRAFDVTLDNGCNISAFLSIENSFHNIQSNAFLGISGQNIQHSRSFIVFSANTFKFANKKAFLLDKSLQIYNVMRNVFVCSCENFGWILSDEKSKIQNSLERDLVISSNCEDGRNLTHAARKCDVIITAGTSSLTPITLLLTMIPLLLLVSH